MSDKGKAVMISLVHWCGMGFIYDIGLKKCYHPSCPNYLKNALIDGTAQDKDLQTALTFQKQCLQDQGQSQFKINRISDEINFLN